MKSDDTSSTDPEGWSIGSRAVPPATTGRSTNRASSGSSSDGSSSSSSSSSSISKHANHPSNMSNISSKSQQRVVGCLLVTMFVVLVTMLLYMGPAPTPATPVLALSKTHVVEARAQIRGGVMTFGSGVRSSSTPGGTLLSNPTAASDASAVSGGGSSMSLLASLQQETEKLAQHKAVHVHMAMLDETRQSAVVRAQSDMGAGVKKKNAGGDAGGLPSFRFRSGAVAITDSATTTVAAIDVAALRSSRKTISSSSSSSIPSAANTDTETDTDSSAAYAQDMVWSQGLQHKLLCMYANKGGMLLYHIRKAAGTSMREVMTLAAQRWHVPLYETEGLTLDWRFLTFPVLKPIVPTQNTNSGGGGQSTLASFAQQAAGASLLSVVTLRDPIDRILSLYWYEHVGWFDGIQKKTEKCATLKNWVSYWSDGSATKTKFQTSNPYNVYVEISNYYVKSLVGWKGPAGRGSSGGGGDGAENVVVNDSVVEKQRSRSGFSSSSSSSGSKADDITAEHLQIAKKVLDSFDIVLLTEWMSDSSQIDALNAVFPGRNIIATKQLLKGDKLAKQRLQETLSPLDELEDMKDALRALNKYDLQLFAYAQSLVARRLSRITDIANRVIHIVDKQQHGGLRGGKSSGPNTDTIAEDAQCGISAAVHAAKLPPELDIQLGIHRPPKHKAPLL